MRTSVRRTTASSQTTTGTTRTTCSSPSTTPMTTLTQCTCTSTDAWRTCTETARASSTVCDDTAHLMTQVLSGIHIVTHGHIHGRISLTRFSLSTSSSSFLSVPVFLFYLELFPELLYTKVMANLRCSAAEESEDTLNAFISPTPSTVDSPFFACRVPISLSASPNRLKTRKSENDLRSCGKLLPKISMISFLKEMIQVPALSLHSTCAITSPQHQGSQERCWKTSFQTCSK